MKKMILVALVGCSNNGSPTSGAVTPEDPGFAKLTATSEAKPSDVERGKLLAMTHACHDCHTPLKLGPNGPAPDFDRALSGHPAQLEMPPAPQLPAGPWLVTVAATNTAWSGPWGVSFTANLTPDNETGTGTWSKETFIATIRNGKHMGVGRPLLPPMPAAMYAKMSDDELGAIYAYLRTIPAISNKVPEPRPPAAPAAAAVDHQPNGGKS